MKRLITFILCIAMLTLTACGTPIEKSDGELNIVCTAFPQYDYVKNILGNENGLILLLDNGGDLHSYEPTAKDIVTIGNADILICIGGKSDEWVEGVVRSAANPELKTVSMMNLVDTYDEEYVSGMEHHENDEHHGVQDEHIWLSLKNSAKITEYLCGVICEIDEENAETYKANTKEYINKIKSLDAEYESVISSAKRNTLLFADRFPFRYLTEDYNLEYHAAFAGCSSESEASFQTIAFLIDKTKELQLPVILTIDGSDGSIANTVCTSTGAKSLVLDSCQSVSSADIEQGTTYIGIMESNLQVLREALN